MKNHGIIPGPQKRSTDFVAGVIPYQILNPTGNWEKSLPPGEWQRDDLVDTMACVTFSLLNCIETQEQFLTGEKINYSDRWIALMSGTTIQGNYLYLVADAVRTYGLVKEESWPAPANYTWDSYYAPPSAAKMAELKAEGKKWLETHSFSYEWLTTSLDDILKHLKQCPLQIVIPGHAIENFYTVDQLVNYFDSYSPFEKQTQRSRLSDVLKPLLTLTKGRTPMLLYKFDDNATEYVLADDATLIGITAAGLVRTLKGRPQKLVILPASQRVNFLIADSVIN